MTFSTVTIRVFHNLENLDFSIDVFYENTFTRNASVFLFFIICQFSALWLFLWCFTIPMKFRNTLIPTISLFLDTIKHTASYGIFIQCKIMCFTEIFSGTYNDAICSVNDYLCFDRMSFLFAGIPFSLFF